VESEVEETPVNRHEQAVTAESAETANGAFRADVDVCPKSVLRAIRHLADSISKSANPFPPTAHCHSLTRQNPDSTSLPTEAAFNTHKRTPITAYCKSPYPQCSAVTITPERNVCLRSTVDAALRIYRQLKLIDGRK
jgi:hypothetical protein